MKRALTAVLAAAGVATIVFAATAAGQASPPSWPPGGPAQVFIWADTVTADTGKQENFFSQGSGVIFRAYAVDLKTKKVITQVTAQYFYVKIPGQPNLKMKYGPQGTGPKAPLLWTATWAIPKDFKTGVVDFRILVHTKTKRHGAFQQAPVEAAQLTVLAGRP